MAYTNKGKSVVQKEQTEKKKKKNELIIKPQRKKVQVDWLLF